MEVVLRKGVMMFEEFIELKQCLIRILDRAEQNAKQGQLSSQDDFDLNDCLKQIKRQLLEIQWSNNRRSRVSPTETTLQACSEYAKNELIKALKKEGI